MAKEISSISLQEDSLVWIEISEQNSFINIKKAVKKSLPMFINHQNIKQTKAILQLSDFIKSIAEEHEFGINKIHLSIPGNFMLIKKIFTDDSIPKENYHSMIFLELEKSWEESSENYQVYLPENTSSNITNEILAVAIRNDAIKFFNSVFENAQLDVELITPSCFQIEEFYKKNYPDFPERILLIGWQNKGFEVILSDRENLIKYSYHPYTITLDPINKINEEVLINSITTVINKLKKTSFSLTSSKDIQEIINYGTAFNPVWIELLKKQSGISTRIFNLDESSGFKLDPNNDIISPHEFFHYVGAVSNIV